MNVDKAITMAKAANSTLPTPELVDRIYEASTCKIFTRQKDPTNPNSLEEQSKEIKPQLEQCPKNAIAADHFKSIVKYNNSYGLYGWRTKDGQLIQNFYNGHDSFYIDYSQGLRLVYRAGFDLVNMKIIDVEEILK